MESRQPLSEAASLLKLETLEDPINSAPFAAVDDSLPTSRDYHLRRHVLTPLETLAQSISTIAPITTPALTIPLVYALAGEGTWLAYLFALLGMTLVAFCIAVFARDSASPGSLYMYTRTTLPPAFGALAAWALFFAYVATASGIIGGFINYAYMFLGPLGAHTSPVLLGAIATAGAVWVAYRDVQVSTRAMLWIEGISVLLLGVLIMLLFWEKGLHLDMPQLKLHDVNLSGVRLGTILAVFSFVGFESATALGTEARDPLTTIPRAVIRKVKITGHTNATITFTSRGGTPRTYQCALAKLPQPKKHRRAVAPHPNFRGRCGSPMIYRHLAAAHYEFFVRVRGMSGGYSSAATTKFTIVSALRRQPAARASSAR